MRACSPELAYAACGPDVGAEEIGAWFSRRFDEETLFGAGTMGIRRPLRFLTWRLHLTSDQVAEAAKILERLKIERAQAAVNLRRAASEFAEGVESEEFGRGHVESAGQTRLEAARRVQETVAGALEELHGLLDEDQREKLAMLIRSRTIVF